MTSDLQTILPPPREWFSPEKIGSIIGRTANTVRQWCRHGRLKARKRVCERGRYVDWEIHADQLWHYCEHGLRPSSRRSHSRSQGCTPC